MKQIPKSNFSAFDFNLNFDQQPRTAATPVNLLSPDELSADTGHQQMFITALNNLVFSQQSQSREIETRITKIEKKISKLHQSTSLYINDLSSQDYRLKAPIKIILKYVEDECLALYPDLELFAEGSNEFAAVAELKNEILDLADDLFAEDDETLGKNPLSWKRILHKLVEAA